MPNERETLEAEISASAGPVNIIVRLKGGRPAVLRLFKALRPLLISAMALMATSVLVTLIAALR